MQQREQTLTVEEADALFEAASDARKHLWTRRDLTSLNSALRKMRRATTIHFAPEKEDQDEG